MNFLYFMFFIILEIDIQQCVLDSIKLFRKTPTSCTLRNQDHQKRDAEALKHPELVTIFHIILFNFQQNLILPHLIELSKI